MMRFNESVWRLPLYYIPYIYKDVRQNFRRRLPLYYVPYMYKDVRQILTKPWTLKPK